jgi:hypothetical protein
VIQASLLSKNEYKPAPYTKISVESRTRRPQPSEQYLSLPEQCSVKLGSWSEVTIGKGDVARGFGW